MSAESQRPDPQPSPPAGTTPAASPAAATPAATAAATIPDPSLSSGETVFYEGGPALGDLIFNLLLGLTIIGIPFAVGAIVRALWLRYRITSRRISVSGGWLGRDRTQVVYRQIREVRAVPRGFGAWGDMVLVLDDGSRLEMRSVPRFREVETYIAERRAARSATSRGAGTGAAGFGDAA